MKFNISKLRYLSQDDFRVLSAIELGMKNHETVPLSVIESISHFQPSLVRKCLRELGRLKLLQMTPHGASGEESYKLGYGGYDFLAMKAFSSKKVLASVGDQLGVGKESDIIRAILPDGTLAALKIHRLGRRSFRTVKNNRDYLRAQRHFSWLYLSKLAATKEFLFMKALYENDFPVPKPIEQNRHCIVMQHLDATPLNQVAQVADADVLYNQLMDLIVRFAEYGLIHGDFNEFNIMLDNKTEMPYVIDFPQMTSTSHENAEFLFNRDVNCIKIFFSKRFNYESTLFPSLTRDVVKKVDLDVSLVASGSFTKQMQKELESFFQLQTIEEGDSEENIDDEEFSHDAFTERVNTDYGYSEEEN